MKYQSKWRQVRPLAALLLTLTGVGAPLTAVILTGADVTTQVVDDLREPEQAEQAEQGGE